jgi:hypothetical protein
MHIAPREAPSRGMSLNLSQVQKVKAAVIV